MAQRGVNKVILIGRLGQELEIKHLPSGGVVVNATLATTETWKDKNTGQQQERTEWHRIVFFNRIAEIAAEYLRKGSRIYLEGSLRTRKWQDQNNQDRYTTEIVVSEMEMLDNKGVNEHQMHAQQRNGGYAPQNSRNTNSSPSRGESSFQQGGYNNQQAGNHAGQYSHQSPAPIDDYIDDIPFGIQ